MRVVWDGVIDCIPEEYAELRMKLSPLSSYNWMWICERFIVGWYVAKSSLSFLFELLVARMHI